MKLPSEEYRNNSSSKLSNLQESRLCQIKMLERGVAPASIVIRQSIIRRAKVGGCHSNGTGMAPFGIIVAAYLEARTTAQAIVEKGSA